MNKLIKSKTFWAGIVGIITAAGGFFTGSLEAGVALQTALTSLIGIFLRHGISKNE